jgi:hypothetical protein
VAKSWLALARHRLNDVFVDTVFADGVQVEQSPFYHNYELSLLLQITSWLARNGVDLTRDVDPRYGDAADEIAPDQRFDFDSSATPASDPDLNRLNPRGDLEPEVVIDAMVRAAVHLAMPDGWVPMIGSSLPQRLRGYQPNAFDAYLARGGSPAEQMLHYMSEGLLGEPPSDDARLSVFGDSGFVTFHSGFEAPMAAQTHLVLNAGMPYHGHSHADALALHVYGPDSVPGATTGRPLLIDSGWFSYRRQERHHFESTRAHNTVSVDGLNQCVRDPRDKRAGPHLDEPLPACDQLQASIPSDTWTAPGRVVRGLSDTGEAAGVRWAYQSALHGLYPGVTHRRGVALIDGVLVAVVDQVVSDRPARLTQAWHVTPDVTAVDPPTRSNGALHFAFSSPGAPEPLFSLHQIDGGDGLLVALRRGEPDVDGVPGQGWHSVVENERAAHTVVELTHADATQATFVSVLALGSLASARPALSLRSDGADVSLEINVAGEATSLEVTRLAEGGDTERVAVRRSDSHPPATHP